MSRAAPAVKPVASDWCDRMAAMPEFDGIVEVAPFFLERKFPERVGHRREKRAAYPKTNRPAGVPAGRLITEPSQASAVR